MNQSYLGGFKHDLCRVIKKSQRPFGESMGTHENCRELDISLPWIHHLLGSKALEINQENIHKALNKCKVPAIAARMEDHPSFTITKLKNSSQINISKTLPKEHGTRKVKAHLN